MRTMKFCILIELSKERISFLYNRSDSDNGFVPFEGQGSLPLAIYCDGNNMEIGQFAVNEANKKNPNAFIDVFKKLRQVSDYVFRKYTHWTNWDAGTKHRYDAPLLSLQCRC